MGKMKTAAAVILFTLLFPYLAALGWTSVFGAQQEDTEEIAEETNIIEPVFSSQKSTGTEAEPAKAQNLTGRKILLDRGDMLSYVELEDYLCGIVAMQIPPEYDLEALRCQAIIARTYIARLMGERMEIAESELDMDYQDEKQLEEYWRAEDYEKLQTAVSSTAELVMQQDGRMILPLFHRINTGMTRTGDSSMPYLQSVESRYDKEAPESKQIRSFSVEGWLKLINGIGGNAAVTAKQIPDTIQVIERDNAGYVVKIQIGTNIYNGDELQTVLGLPSAAFRCEADGKNIQMNCTGAGHGYGLSQYGASRMGEEGWQAEDILKYYYKNISIISE